MFRFGGLGALLCFMFRFGGRGALFGVLAPNPPVATGLYQSMNSKLKMFVVSLTENVQNKIRFSHFFNVLKTYRLKRFWHGFLVFLPQHIGRCVIAIVQHNARNFNSRNML